MPERHRAAQDVQTLLVDAEGARRRHRHDRERLVDLEDVDVARRPAGLVEQRAQGADRRGGEVGRRLGVRGMPDDARADRRAAAPASASISTSAAAPSLSVEALPAVIVPVFSKAGRSVGSLSKSTLAGPSSTSTIVSALAARDLDRDDLAGGAAVGGRGLGASVGARARRRPDRRAAIAYSTAHPSAQLPMWRPSKASSSPSRRIESTSAPSPNRRPARAPGRAVGAWLMDSGRRPRPPGRRRRRSRAALDDRLEAAAAHLLTRDRGRAIQQARAERGLARRRLAGARGEHLAHVHGVDVARARRRPASARRGSRPRRARWRARTRGRPGGRDGGADGAGDDDGHGDLLGGPSTPMIPPFGTRPRRGLSSYRAPPVGAPRAADGTELWSDGGRVAAQLVAATQAQRQCVDPALRRRVSDAASRCR